MATDQTEAQLLLVLLRAADKQGLPVSLRQVQALAATVAGWLAEREQLVVEESVPVSPLVAPSVAGPTPAQLDCLIEKARDRRLSPAEVGRLRVGVLSLRTCADLRGAPYVRDPLEVACAACGAVPGVRCRKSGGGRSRIHRARLRLCVG